MKHRFTNCFVFFALSLLALTLCLANIFIGSVNIAFSDIIGVFFGKMCVSDSVRFIILDSRLPAAVTAMFAGAGLAVSGLMMQTCFRNPLAGPSVLGVNSGASLGVAVVMLWGGFEGIGIVSDGGWSAVMIGAFVGAITVMALLLLLANLLKNNVTLLVAGMMLGYLASSAITLLNFRASSQGIQEYVMWGMSSFSGFTRSSILPFVVGMSGLIFLSMMMVKPLNLLLLGERYAGNLGLNVVRSRNMLLLLTSGLSALITAYCGPVAFIGLATPHIARLFFSTDNHRVLMPATILCGIVIASGCNLLCHLPSIGVLPLNAITPLVGAPVILWVIIRSKI